MRFVAQAGGQLLEVLVEVRRVVDEAAALAKEVVEVQRAALAARERLVPNGVDGLADDPGFDLRRRVDADDRGAVRDRVVERRPCGSVVRELALTRPDHRVLEVVEAHA